jgi:hypothetical protein
MNTFPINIKELFPYELECETGLVTSLVAKRDTVLAAGIEECIEKGLPLDSLTSDKKDYTVCPHMPVDVKCE